MKKYFSAKDARTLITAYGFALFPIHGIDEKGNCTCGVKDCSSKGKHPATNDGFKSATKDIEKLKTLWYSRKYLNVGIATGAASNIFVIDIDSAVGEENLNALGKIPKTLTVLTGKGKHLYFSYPVNGVITLSGILPGVDVRGDGGYVAGPNSNHLSGKVYIFDNPLEVIAEAPQFILDLVLKSKQKRNTQSVTGVTRSLLNISSNWSEDDARGLLSHISPDVGYDEWIAVGMAIHSEGLSFHLWDEWSKSSAKYDGSTGAHWKSFNPGKGVSFGTVVHMAKEGGWMPASPKYNKPNGLPSDIASQPAPLVDPETGEVIKVPTIATTKERTIQYIYSDDITPSIDVDDFVQNTLGNGQMSVVYGESNCGKTFFMTDLAFHVALGRAWRDKRVEQGAVIYVALESPKGLRNRIAAFKQENNNSDVSMPLAVVSSHIDFMNPKGNIDEFINVIQEIKEDKGDIKLIVIDTLSRALMGGDENSGQDMGMLVYHADKIRATTGAHICFIHHSGKDSAKGARGHSSLRAAVDTEIEIHREREAEYSSIKIVKQREMEMGEDMFFALKQVVLGTNEYDEEVTSCVVEAIDEPEHVSTYVKLSANEEFVYEALVYAIDTVGSDRYIQNMGTVKCIDYFQMKDVLEARGAHEFFNKDKEAIGDAVSEAVKRRTKSAREGLKYKGKIGFDRHYVWMIR